MMKKTFILFLLIALFSYSYAQLANSYSINIAEKKGLTYILDFNLYVDGEYLIDFTEMYCYPTGIENNFIGDAMIMRYPLFQGKYELVNDTLILIDSYTLSQFVYIFNNPYLRPIKTFPFLMEKVFIDYGYKTKTILENNIEKTDISIEKILSDFEIINHYNYNLEKGSYVYNICADTRFEMILNNDMTYDFCFKREESYRDIDKLNFIFSTGIWDREGNILILWDTNLQHKFYGLIREDGIELLFFRWGDDMVLKKNDAIISKTNDMNKKYYLPAIIVFVILLLSFFLFVGLLKITKKVQ